MTDNPTPETEPVRFSRRFVVHRPGASDVHGVEFPSGYVIADGESGLEGATSIQHLCEVWPGHSIEWAEEDNRDR